MKQHDSKTAARRIFQETLAAIDIPAAIARWVESSEIFSSGSWSLGQSSGQSAVQFQEIVAIAYGKASVAMAQGFQTAIGGRVPVRGILVRPELTQVSAALPGWEIFAGGHPIPNEASFAAGRAILACLSDCSENSLVVFLISGGGSSMVEAPLDPGVSAEEFQALHAALVTCGAPIEEINVVRKHLSATKGGRLAQAAPRARKITLAVSDVPVEHESALASGPTIPDPTTVADADRVVTKYGLRDRLPAGIRKIFAEKRLQETPKQGDKAFANAHFETLLGEHDLVHRSHHCCEAEGIFCMADDQTDGWPLEKAADELLGQLEAMQRDYPGKRVAILSGGELSSPVTGDGVGGRNSAFVLACVPKIAGKKIAVLSAGTDGIDGNSPAAGAVADGETLARAEVAGINWQDYMARSDAYNFFKKLDDAIVTGPTGNNLRDLRILISG